MNEGFTEFVDEVTSIFMRRATDHLEGLRSTDRWSRIPRRYQLALMVVGIAKTADALESVPNVPAEVPIGDANPDDYIKDRHFSLAMKRLRGMAAADADRAKRGTDA